VWVWLISEGFTPVFVKSVPDAGYEVKAVTDFTGDGLADILWQHATAGDLWLWTMNGGTAVAEQYVGTVADTGYRIRDCGDYNLDGRADIAWHHATLGEVWIWMMDGAAKLSEGLLGVVADTGYQIVR